MAVRRWVQDPPISGVVSGGGRNTVGEKRRVRRVLCCHRGAVHRERTDSDMGGCQYGWSPGRHFWMSDSGSRAQRRAGIDARSVLDSSGIHQASQDGEIRPQDGEVFPMRSGCIRETMCVLSKWETKENQMYYVHEKLVKSIQQDRMLEAHDARTYGLPRRPGLFRRLAARSPIVRQHRSSATPPPSLVRRTAV